MTACFPKPCKITHTHCDLHIMSTNCDICNAVVHVYSAGSEFERLLLDLCDFAGGRFKLSYLYVALSRVRHGDHVRVMPGSLEHLLAFTHDPYLRMWTQSLVELPGEPGVYRFDAQRLHELQLSSQTSVAKGLKPPPRRQSTTSSARGSVRGGRGSRGGGVGGRGRGVGRTVTFIPTAAAVARHDVDVQHQLPGLLSNNHNLCFMNAPLMAIAASNIQALLREDRFVVPAQQQGPLPVSVAGDQMLTRALAHLVQCISGRGLTMESQWHLIRVLGEQFPRFARVQRHTVSSAHANAVNVTDDAKDFLDAVLTAVCNDLDVNIASSVVPFHTETLSADCELQWIQLFLLHQQNCHLLLVRVPFETLVNPICYRM